jgi:long-chain fatty acid transport protein
VVAVGLRIEAEGFRNPPPSTFGLGRAGGRVAQIDDASAVTHNPANLVDVPRPEFSLTPSLIYIRVEHDAPSGGRTRTEDPWKVLPNLYASLPVVEDRVTVGVGVSTPYGISNEWPKDGAFKYLAPYFTELKTIDASLGVGWRATDWLQVGAALDVYWSQLDLNQDYPWGLVVGSPTATTGDLMASGDGWAVGGTLGVTVQLAPKHRLAAKFKPPFDIDYRGHVSLDHVPASLGGGNLYSEFASQIRFPTIVGMGYGVELSSKVRIEADVEWLEFSRFEKLPIGIGAPPPGLPSEILQDWDDTFTVGVAGDWRFHPAWVMRAGYQFYETPVPDYTFSPTIPDSNQHVITVGLGYEIKRSFLELAYGGIFYDDRHIQGNQVPGFDGDYRFTVHLFSFNFRYRF